MGKHIVLTHFEHKPKIIETYDILSIYLEFLEMAIDESEEILMFGYSGNDAHLNRLISQVRGEKNIRVIERLGAGNRTRLTLPPTFIQRERDSWFEFCRFGRVGQRGLARSFADCAASGPVAG